MDSDGLFARYRELQDYVGWDESDAQRVHAVGPILTPYLPALIDDFYAAIERHSDARKVITGGQQQIDRLKGTLIRWLQELFEGPYDQVYVVRRFRVGWRHVEIGLDQVFTNVALSRLRTGLIGALGQSWQGDQAWLVAAIRSVDKLLDLDLAMIEDAYQAEHAARQQRSERLAAIGQVAGGVAHELRNPLNVVKTSAYFLLNARSVSPEKATEHLQRIGQHVDVADGVVTALSNFAKMPIPVLSPFSVANCIKQALTNNPVPKSVAVEIDIPETLPSALGDTGQVGIVFGNLIRNAREAMGSGGGLRIAALAGEGFVQVTIADTGIGIPRESLSLIMEPLYSTKARGIGLGLALSKAILDKHQGTIHVESEVGRGTTFTVRLLSAQ
jgi:signal transduction histidine kinase